MKNKGEIMKIDHNKIIEAINQLSAEGSKINITSLSRITDYTYTQLYQSEYGFLCNGWSLYKRNKLFWLDNEELNYSFKFRIESLHQNGFWFIYQQGEDNPFMTTNPVYIKAYEHLFIDCKFVRVQ